MNKKLIYIGLDVDDTQYHGGAFDKETGEIVSFKCRPTLKGLVLQLEKLHKYFEKPIWTLTPRGCDPPEPRAEYRNH